MEATRTRILEAGAQLYAERGISATTMREIGERADVAPGTLRNHFASRERLDQAMVDWLRLEGPLPELSIFEGAMTIEDRLRRLFVAAQAFFVSAARIYRMWLREPMLTKPWQVAGAQYGQRWDALMRSALGPLADDEQAVAVLRAVLQPPFFERITADGRSNEETVDLVSAVVGPWFAGRLAARR